MTAHSSDPANATVTLSQKLNKLITDGSLDYSSWRSLILEIETESPEDINTITLAYDSLLLTFPLCHWHLGKYAHHKAKLGSPHEVVNIYERRAGLAMFSIGFWADYFEFGASNFGNPEDVRRLFRRALSFVDKDYFCHALWDKYMKYEFDLEGWSFLAHSYIRALRFPTKKLQFYYNNFKQFVANLEEEMCYTNSNDIVEKVSVPCALNEISTDEISVIITDLLDSSDKSVKSKALDRYKSIGEEFYLEALQMDKKIECFEKKIRRRYFFATPLDDDQLDNWHLYLDFIEKQDNMDWAMNLYERCLIPCANYPELWMRYVEFLESKGGRELAISALDRATKIFVKNVREIHLFNARFMEHIGDVRGAREALFLCDKLTDSSFIENVVTLANLERRLGNFAAASAVYKKALKNARVKRRENVLPSLYNHFARLTLLTTGGNAAAARDVLIKGVRDVPNCRYLLEELIKFAMTHEGASQVNIIDPLISDAISTGSDEYNGLSAKDREDISNLYIEFVNLCGTIHEIRKAWNRHINLFPQFLRMNTTNKLLTSPADYSERDKKGQEKDHVNNTKGTTQALSTKAIVLSNEDASQHDRSAYELSCQSKGDESGPTVSAELGNSSDGKILAQNPARQNSQLGDVEEDKQDKNHPIITSTSQQPLQAQAMSEMMLYNYQQQQYQHMQNPYSQMQYNYYNQQQAYQMQPHYGYQQNNQQIQNQYHDHAYQAYQLAYQHQGQQMLLQQYQHLPFQQQSTEGMQEQQNLTQNPSQNQEICAKPPPPEHDSPAESSDSPHLRAQSRC